MLAIISSLIPRVCSRRHCVAIGGVRVRILFYSTAELATRNRYQTDKTEALCVMYTKRKYSNLPIKNLLSAKKIAGVSMRNRRAPGLTENTDHVQQKTLTSDSFFRRKNSTGLADLLQRDLTGPS